MAPTYQDRDSLQLTMAKIALAIFDFDGTLVDTAPDLIRSTNLFLESKGFAPLPPERIRAEIGMGLRKLIVDLHPEPITDPRVVQKIEADFLKLYESEFLSSPKLFTGAMEFLSEWEGQIAIVSNKRIRFITPILEKLGLDQLPWSAVIGGDTFSNMKPHPEPLLAAMQAANVDVSETVMVGDGHPDVRGAVGLGMRCVAVEFGYTPVTELMELGAWRSIGNFSELLPLLRSQ